MRDIHIKWNPQAGQGQWMTDADALLGADDLITAYLISIFSDRLAHEDDLIPDNSGNRRGWVGDEGEIILGSRLWLLSRAKQTAETQARAFDYLNECLQWAITDGVVVRNEITVKWVRASVLGAQIVAYKKDGSNVAMNFSWAWEGIG